MSFFAGAGAEQLADQTSLERVDNTFFNTEIRRNQLDRALQRAASAVWGSCRGTPGICRSRDNRPSDHPTDQLPRGTP